MEIDIDWLSMRGGWVGLRGVGMVKSSVLEKNVLWEEIRYFVTSLVDANKFADVALCIGLLRISCIGGLMLPLVRAVRECIRIVLL